MCNNVDSALAVEGRFQGLCGWVRQLRAFQINHCKQCI
jgi:hypothetical protein